MLVIFSFLIIVICFFVSPCDSYAITSEEGQAAFDAIFWVLMTIWALGVGFGLAVKLINRS